MISKSPTPCRSTEIAPDRAGRDNKRLADFDNSMAILSYSPGAVGERWTGDKPIPAITEFDWAGGSPPCLPADMLPRKG
jgi:hypothetical protein